MILQDIADPSFQPGKPGASLSRPRAGSAEIQASVAWAVSGASPQVFFHPAAVAPFAWRRLASRHPAVDTEIQGLVGPEVHSFRPQQRLLKSRRQVGHSVGGAASRRVDHAMPGNVARAPVQGPPDGAWREPTSQQCGNLAVGHHPAAGNAAGHREDTFPGVFPGPLHFPVQAHQPRQTSSGFRSYRHLRVPPPPRSQWEGRVYFTLPAPSGERIRRALTPSGDRPIMRWTCILVGWVLNLFGKT